MPAQVKSPYAINRSATTQRNDGNRETRRLDEWRDEPAYVLLGDPGAGKSWSFRSEARATGGQLLVARFIQDGIEPAVDPSRTVFIDALDEVRGSASGGSDVLGAVAKWLRQSGLPRFRIACREADWRQDADRMLIERVLPAGQLTVLHLEPLDHNDILEVLRHRLDEVPDPQAFLAEAERHGVSELLGNPLLLDLTVKAVAPAGGKWPKTRLAVYEGACRQLAQDASDAHRQRVALKAGHIDRLLDDAGLLCAVLLLSGRTTIRLSGQANPDDVDIQALPAALQIHDAEFALESKVFASEGGRATPRHRTIAEFLAARAIARRVEHGGLPLGRVLALLQGFDGKPVESLRGLLAWLAVRLHADKRLRLLRLDPLGFILNGDAAALTQPERVVVLDALAEAASENQWFRAGQWVDHPFGPLATTDMTGYFEAQLRHPDRGAKHQVFVDCLLDALAFARDDMPSLAPTLATWVVDETAFDSNRLAAYKAWKRHCQQDRQSGKIKVWLDGIFEGTIKDADDRLLGRLLQDAYPSVLATDVLDYLRPRKTRQSFAEFSDFWNHRLLRQTPRELLAELADAWVLRFPNGLPHEWQLDAQGLADELLLDALDERGDRIPVERLYGWLGIGFDEYKMGRSRTAVRQKIAGWLQARPALMKSVVAHGFAVQRPDAHGHRHFWRAESRLRGATRPRDWLSWTMELAAGSQDEDFVQWVVHSAASAVLDPPAGLDAPSLDGVEAWVRALATRFPQASDWLQSSWTMELAHWRGDDFRRQARHRAERSHAREQRKGRFEKVLAGLGAALPPAGFLNQVALAYEKRFTDIEGDTPEARVEDLLGSGPDATTAALAALDATLQRDDLPTADDILALEAMQRFHVIRPAVLLAARRAAEHDPDVWVSWSDKVLNTVVAFWLTDGLGEEPTWYRGVAAHRPERIAPLLVRHASAQLKRKGPHSITGLWGLAHDEKLERLAQLALPALLDQFPRRAHQAARQELNRSLLAALPRIDGAVAATIVARKLEQPGLDPGQRIAWLVAQLPYDLSAGRTLADWVGRNPRRATILGIALREQGSLKRTTQRLSPSTVRHLVEVLAPIIPYEPHSADGFVTEAMEREELVKHLLAELGGSATAEARSALVELMTSGRLGQWQAIAEYQWQTQRSAYREATFRVPEPERTALVLSNGAPAHITDLMALTIDHLADIEHDIRGSAGFALRQFWHDDGTPVAESIARDVLLDRLKPRLAAQKVDVESESRAAAEKRADIRVTFMPPAGKRLALPIEVKKDAHNNVWAAWRDQLQALYSNDPDADGHGLYLVLWFGHRSKASPEGRRPTSAQDLAESIRARIPEADRQRLRVHVMDLSWPAQAKR